MALNFQQLIMALQQFWAGEGAVIQQPYDVEVGAGTMHPDTFFRVLGPEPWRAAYCSPSRRPVDGRYGQNPFRLYRHYQFQVILKPSPPDVQDLYLRSLSAFGVDPREHDIRFEEDNWESPTLGAAGVGWQVMMDGMEITQFTYFQQAGGIELSPIAAEITYGSERICMFLNGVSNVFDLAWSDGVPYGDVRMREEVEFSRHNFDASDVDLQHRLFRAYVEEAERLLERGPDAPRLRLHPALFAHLQRAGGPRSDQRHRADRLHSDDSPAGDPLRPAIPRHRPESEESSPRRWPGVPIGETLMKQDRAGRQLFPAGDRDRRDPGADAAGSARQPGTQTAFSCRRT